VLVCFDATVLCGAIRKPTGINFKLLELAAAGVVLEGFTSDVAGMGSCATLSTGSAASRMKSS
jgi:hypothetical protein